MNISRRQFLQHSAGALAACSLAPGRLVNAAPALSWDAIGANTAITGAGLYEAIALLQELKFPTIEVHPFGVSEPTEGVFPGFEFGEISAAEKEKIREALKGFRHLTTHLPYKGLLYFARPAEWTALAQEKMKHALAATAFFGAELAVCHVIAPKGLPLQEAWPEMLRQYRSWGDIAAAGNFRIAIETGYPASVAEFVRLIQEIDHPQIGATLDVGHQIWYRDFKERVKEDQRSTPEGIRAYNDVIHEIIDQLGAKLFHFHVHDIDPADWKEHKPIGFDVIDYPRLMKKLRATNYRGLLVLEIGAPDMRASLTDNKQRLEKFVAAAG